MTLSPLFKLLSDETRLRVLLLLQQSDLCVCELCGILNEPQPKISKILSKLRDLNIVTDLRKDKFVFYSYNATDIVLNEILTMIKKNSHNYPNLKEDQQRLLYKENYIDTCTISSLQSIERN